MEKKHTIQRISNKKRGRPKVRFNFMILIIITAITFAICFVLYMVKANVSGDALSNDNEPKTAETTTAVQSTEPASGEAAQQTTEATAPGPDPSIKYPLPASAAADASYFENCCLITDKTLLDISKYSNFKDVLGNASMNALNCNTTAISSTYGNVTAAQTIQLKKPMNLYLMLGSDIGANSTDDMIASYTSMVSQLHNYLPEMHIYIMQLPPPSAGNYTVTVETVDQYNSKLLEMAKTLGVYCIDTNTALRSADGTIADEYWDAETGGLSEEGYKAVSGYILTHTV